jgi:EAL domain-containing protein (putative c-di-GMP-specific phosphodiesterase class I)
VQRCLGRAAEDLGLSSACQPIVSLPEDVVVGFEALTRWPQLGNPTPGDVFIRALATKQLSSLNQLCLDSAIDAALAAGLPRNTLLLINSEPGGKYRGLSDDAALARARGGFRLIYELTERNLLDHRRELLEMVAALRADGISIALNDVGAHPDSLDLLEILEPEVVKFDRALVQSRLREVQVRVIAAVLAHRKRTGAAILADGIETDDHLQRALELGATLGQGPRFGHLGGREV